MWRRQIGEGDGVTKHRHTREAELFEAFREALDDAIAAMDVTEGEFGYRVGVTGDTINRYRRGGREPSVGRALFLAETAGFSLDGLLRDATPSDRPRDVAPGGLPLDVLVPPPETGRRRRRQGRGGP